MYFYFKEETILRFDEVTKYHGGWKLIEFYDQVHAAKYKGVNEIRVEVTLFGGLKDGYTFDWSKDITAEENPVEKFNDAKITILKILLTKMLDTNDSACPWGRILGVREESLAEGKHNPSLTVEEEAQRFIHYMLKIRELCYPEDPSKLTKDDLVSFVIMANSVRGYFEEVIKETKK